MTPLRIPERAPGSRPVMPNALRSGTDPLRPAVADREAVAGRAG